MTAARRVDQLASRVKQLERSHAQLTARLSRHTDGLVRLDASARDRLAWTVAFSERGLRAAREELAREQAAQGERARRWRRGVSHA